MTETERAPLAAVVDLGTNAARLAMASLDASGRLVPRGRWRELIRLGEGLAESGSLSEEVMERGLACLERFAAHIRAHSVDALDAIATSAVREAENGADFLRRAQALGIPLRAIGADEEARLALAGVLSGWERPPADALVFDVGGGSLELIRAAEGRLADMVSLPAGVVYLTERFLREIPTHPDQVAACAREVRAMLSDSGFSPPPAGPVPLIGCGGAVALAWFIKAGAPEGGRIDGVEIDAGEVAGWIGRFAALDWNGRHSLGGFEPGREDIALAGLVVLGELLRWGGRERFRISTAGVREGRLLELLGARNA